MGTSQKRKIGTTAQRILPMTERAGNGEYSMVVILKLGRK